MSRKVEQIVDPETGKVVAEKHYVTFGSFRYNMTVKSKLALALLRVAAVCCFLSILCGIVFLIVPTERMRYVAIPLAAFSITMFVSGYMCLFTLYVREMREKKLDSGKDKSK